ncbi:MAG: threonine--tRNA ligase, partial [Bdellovibrionales bacterium]|nr:threonine--tRNA ligase [Bdellovibrionales bacterium]
RFNLYEGTMTEKDHLYRIRHSLAHVLAQAVLSIRPEAKLGFGPPIDTGCYYDFRFGTPLSPEDFEAIEKKMRSIIAEKQVFEHQLVSVSEAIQYLESENEDLKVEYCKELAEGGETQIGFYTNGPFKDMCAGPHVEHTGNIPPDCFAIDSLAGAYWRGDEKREQLTRIYLLAFESKKLLKEFKERRKLAEERDHRKLGKELELYTISEEVGPGLILWLPNGTVLREELETFAKEVEQRFGYQRVSTPHIARETLYYTSGHLPYYADGMFPPMVLEDEANYYLKAMNCPHHHMIYGVRPRSYRELPLRLAEYGCCYRYESSGSLSGLLRVRCLSMNDAHLYCTLGQVKDELKATFQLTLDYYNKFRFENIKVRFSTHDPAHKDKFVDNPELWKFSEKIVQEVIDELGIEVIEGPGEAAFYGPKLDFQATTALGREESISTTQLDFAQPLNFKLTYVAEDGKEQRPYVIHRAPLGTHERFLAFLIEHFGGAFPTWMAPTQVRIIPVNKECEDYAFELQRILRDKLYRAEVDTSDNSFNKKIRAAVTHKTPNMLIIGKQEVEAQTVTLRRYCTKDQIQLSRDAFVQRMEALVEKRVMDNFPDIEVL